MYINLKLRNLEVPKLNIIHLNWILFDIKLWLLQKKWRHFSQTFQIDLKTCSTENAWKSEDNFYSVSITFKGSLQLI